MKIIPLQPCPNTLNNQGEKKKWWNWLGWSGAFFVVFGYYLNANMYVSSWLVWIIGNILVGIYSIKKEAYSTALMSFIIAALNIYGYFSWL